jgi:hypothetical protein
MDVREELKNLCKLILAYDRKQRSRDREAFTAKAREILNSPALFDDPPETENSSVAKGSRSTLGEK